MVAPLCPSCVPRRYRRGCLHRRRRMPTRSSRVPSLHVTLAGPCRMLFVRLDPRRSDLMAFVGHELQHACHRRVRRSRDVLKATLRRSKPLRLLLGRSSGARASIAEYFGCPPPVTSPSPFPLRGGSDLSRSEQLNSAEPRSVLRDETFARPRSRVSATSSI